MPGLVCCAFAALLLFTSCAIPVRDSPTTGPTDCLSSLADPASVTGLFVEPDDGEPPVVEEIQGARCAVDVSVYLLSDDAVIDALIDAAQRRVQVRVMLEEFPFGGGGGQDAVRDQLEDAGVSVRWSASDIRFSHAKYLVVDRQVAIIMNLNLTNSAFYANREFGVVTTDPASVRQAQEIFDRDWSHEPIDDPDGPLIVSPTNSRERMLEMIDGADRSIDFYAEVIRDPEIIAAIGNAVDRGVSVRLIVDQSIDADSQDALVELFDLGVDIRLASHLYIHAKLMVIDGAEAIVGSQNFTATSLDDNRELAMIVTDQAALDRAGAIFERDWQRSSPGAPT